MLGKVDIVENMILSKVDNGFDNADFVDNDTGCGGWWFWGYCELWYCR